MADERGVVALLAGVEAQVLQQLDAGRQLGEARRAPASIEYFGSGLPFGRPRWLAVDDAGRRARCSHSIVGSAARMRKSSVIASPSSSSGTLKSVRTSTRLPSSDPSALEILERRETVGHCFASRSRRRHLRAGVQR